MNSFVIKLNQKDVENLVMMIKNHDEFSGTHEIIGEEELVSFAEGLLHKNTKCMEFLKKIEFDL